MKYVKNQLTKAHGIVFGILLGIFAVWTFLIVDAGLDTGDEHYARVFITTLGTITGPLTGAISRNFQGCCLRASFQIMTCCAPILGIGLGIQFIGASNGKKIQALRMCFWILGWVVWFGGGIVSFLHALS